MQRTGETYTEYQKRVLCENSSKLTNQIISPQCFNGRKEYEVKIIYSDLENDTLYLCKECRDKIKKDARKHGYKVRTKKL